MLEHFTNQTEKNSMLNLPSFPERGIFIKSEENITGSIGLSLGIEEIPNR
jgi:hypothetical protein